ncbi:MAG: DNA-3-methyladenine glycosylase 2 family protein [Firmicutes bacterium]|jgi:hhH-GPD family protein|nr:DNA-3-methyladenine glycosylase 2 family protein [Clostridia bacterium]MBS5023122.1 DNA-3-methyladenine glycosylase 2 family protein [Bacillota bacterium]
MAAYEEEERAYVAGKDPVMKELVERFGRLEIRVSGDIFADLVSDIVGQMLSNRVAEVIVGRLRALAGGLTPEKLLAKTLEEIKNCGMSARKAEYILALSRDVKEGKYDFSRLDSMTDGEAIAYLMKIKGVGRWTAEMIAEFSLGRKDIFSYDDMALRNGIVKAHGFKTLSKKRFERLRKKYSPYASVASLYYYRLNDEK